MSFYSLYDILEQVEHRNPIYRKGGRMEREYPTQLYLDDIFDPDWSVECIIDTYKNDPYGFETFISWLCQDMGYEAQVTQQAHDGGYDIRLQRDGRVYLVECKCFASNHAIGRPVLQRLVGVNAVQHADGVVCVTTSHFSQEAIQYAAQAGVNLIDGDELTTLIRRFLVV